jgi:hypothetical protein
MIYKLSQHHSTSSVPKQEKVTFLYGHNKHATELMLSIVIPKEHQRLTGWS